MHDLVIAGGRVVDPSTATDAVLDIALDGDRVAAVGPGLEGRSILKAAGCVVAPGFIDLHSHAQSLAGQRLQALDGVTTALDLEAGVPGIELAYAAAAAEGRHLHYGFSASWAGARMRVLADLSYDGRVETLLSHLAHPDFQREATAAEQDLVLAALQDELADGALGIGVLVGYAPGTDPQEYLRVAQLAATTGVPTYTHARDLVDFTPNTRVDGAVEIVRAAAETGAHMHYCHVNSTSLRAVDRVHALIERARSEGSIVTTEAYPYGAGMAGIGAAFLAPDRLGERGLAPSDLVLARTGERIADASRLRELRDTDPGALAVIHFFNDADPADAAVLVRNLLFQDTCIASDAMPMAWIGPPQEERWPLPPEAMNHPRTAGTFARSFDTLVRGGHLGIIDFVRRASTLPAEVVRAATGGRARRGRLSVGSDADVVVLDPQAYRDEATYAHPTRPSVGVRHLIVAGAPVVRDGSLLFDSRPGRAVRR